MLSPLLFLAKGGHLVVGNIEQGGDELEFFRRQSRCTHGIERCEAPSSPEVHDFDIRKALFEVCGEGGVEVARSALHTSQLRLAALAKERKPLTDEAEFYVGKPLPFKLQLALDANDAAVDAQNSLMQNQKLEVVRIDKNYDDELDRLRKLWNGARPGSLGALAAASTPAAAPPRR